MATWTAHSLFEVSPGSLTLRPIVPHAGYLPPCSRGSGAVLPGNTLYIFNGKSPGIDAENIEFTQQSMVGAFTSFLPSFLPSFLIR
jgi:hypothetical protein